jgi:hypothetical protein
MGWPLAITGSLGPEPAMAFVTGLPRCRSAWLSVLFDVKPAWSAHEPLKNCLHKGPDAVRAYFRKVYATRIVCCDTGAPSDWRTLDRIYPGARWLVVRRPTEEAAEAAVRALALPDASDAMRTVVRTLAAAIEEMVPALGDRCMTIDFADLDDEAKVEAAWRWVMPRIAWDADRYRRLNLLKIEVERAKWYDDLKALGLIAR